ncbi:MAG: hypothetical protein L7U87_02945 [Chlamydiales bacterium]|nr:hypothetical protein [Chlamydiales bacterium]
MSSIIFWGKFFSGFFILMGFLLFLYRDLFIATMKQMKENYSARFVWALVMWIWAFLILSNICEFSFSFAGLFTLLAVGILIKGVTIWAYFHVVESFIDSSIYRKFSPVFSLLYIAFGLWINYRLM